MPEQKIKIITDSASDITFDIAEKLDIEILPFTLNFNSESYKEGIDFTRAEFYDIIRNTNEIPTTSQITALEFSELFEGYYKKGYTDIIYVSISSKGSNTFMAANMARDEFFQNNPGVQFGIHLLDSLVFSLGYGYPVIEAAKKILTGAEIGDVLAYIKDWLEHSKIFFSIYEFKYARKSGRINAVAAIAGELLGIRPILSYKDGESISVGKVRGDAKVIPAILETARKSMIPQTPYNIVGGANESLTAEMVSEAEKFFGYPPEMITQLGATITCHAGPELIAICCKGK